MTPHHQPDEFHVSLAPATRALLEDIKRDGGYLSDAEAIRAALAMQHLLARRMAEGFRVVLRRPGSQDREVKIGGAR